MQMQPMNPGPLHFLPCNPGTFSISRYSRFKIEHDWAPEASSVHVQTCQDALHPPRVFTPKCSKSFRPPLRNGRDLSWWHPNSHHRQNLINKNHAFINAQYEIIQKIVFSQSSCLSSPSWNSWPAWECRTRQFNWLKRARHQRGLGMFEMFEMFGCVPLHVMWSCVPGNAGKRKHSALRSISPRFRSLETTDQVECSKDKFEMFTKFWTNQQSEKVHAVSGCFFSWRPSCFLWSSRISSWSSAASLKSGFPASRPLGPLGPLGPPDLGEKRESSRKDS